MRRIEKEGSKLVKFLSLSNDDSVLHLSYVQIIFPAGFIGQGVSMRMLQLLDGAR
jgi:hypothetical protein